MKKILISDFDKTLYCDDDSLKINIEKIKEFREKGNLFVIATARSYISLNAKLKEYNILYDYIILGHGTVILNNKEELILNYSINNDVVKKIIIEMNKFKEKIKLIRIFDIYREDVDVNCENITKFRMLTETYGDAEEISKYTNCKYGEVVKSYPMDGGKYIFVEVIPIDTDKGNAIEKILDIENIKYENVYTIGDGANDVEMIEKYNGYGMKNSIESVLKVTNKLVDNVYELIDKIM